MTDQEQPGRSPELTNLMAALKAMPVLDTTSTRTASMGWHAGGYIRGMMGPSPTWVREQLARFTYKPGWTFKIVESNSYMGSPHAYLAVYLKTEDTYHPGHQIEIGGSFELNYLPEDEERFARKLAEIVRDLEIHESREWLRRDGEIFDNPHDPRPFR